MHRLSHSPWYYGAKYLHRLHVGGTTKTDGELMYPKKQVKLTAEEYMRKTEYNPEESAARGLWSEPEFLENVTDLNPALRHTQFADYHGHGWVFRAVFKKDRQGHLLDWKKRSG